VGRKPTPIRKRTTKKYSYHNLDDELEHRLQMMAKREGTTVGALRVQAIREYDERHWKGNYQTLMESYDEGGEKSDGQLEMQIVNKLAKKKRDLSRSDIYPLLADVKPEKREHSFENIRKELTSRGVKVWQ